METSFSNQITSKFSFPCPQIRPADAISWLILIFISLPVAVTMKFSVAEVIFLKFKEKFLKLQCWSHKFFNIIKNSVISQADRNIILQQDEVLQTIYWQVAQQVNWELSLYGLRLWGISGLQIIFLLGIQDLKAWWLWHSAD